jgi:predicted molibdopterin-dependent oxidoreductase YjgC
MAESIVLSINGNQVSVPPGTTVAVAILVSGVSSFRKSVSGEPRSAFCGMGICYECRVTIDGRAHCRSCQMECLEGMKVTVR